MFQTITFVSGAVGAFAAIHFSLLTGWQVFLIGIAMFVIGSVGEYFAEKEEEKAKQITFQCGAERTQGSGGW